MQKNAKNKNGLEPVYKPYLKGNAVSGLAAKRGLRVLGMIVLFAFLFMIVSVALSIDNFILRLVINLGMVAICCWMMFAEGSRQGENDVSFAEIALNRQNNGKPITKKDRDTCFHPLKGFFTAAVGVAPFFLIALVFALIATRQTFQLSALPSWVSAYDSQPEISQALAYYNNPDPTAVEDVLRFIVRMLLFPYINIVGTDNYDTMLLMDRLSPVLVLITPLFYALGYLRGPSLRALVHGNIRLNKRRHNRKERKAREQRVRKPEAKELI
jgi:hypothetical protein